MIAMLPGVKWIVRMILALACVAAPVVAGETRPLRVLTWNLQHGVGEDHKLDLQRIASVIRDAKPDLVALQEIDQNCRRSGKIDQAAELAKLTGLTGIFGQAMDFDGGAYGQAILSRYPISSHKVHPLPGKGEPRIAIEALVSIDGKQLRFITAHLDLDATQRLAQAQVLVKLTAAATPAAILCGDFNDTPGSPPLAVFSPDWTTVPKNDPPLTYPAHKPNQEIDHMFAKGISPTEPLVVLPEALASDHRPLLALFSPAK